MHITNQTDIAIFK